MHIDAVTMGKTMAKISSVHAREVLDSRGRPTVEVEVAVESGARGVAMVPSGASVGRHEAIELRDGDPARFQGRGVLKAVENVNSVIAPLLRDWDVVQQRKIDCMLIELDGTANKSKLGANAILAVSLACARAAANVVELPLYRYIGGLSGKRLPLPMVSLVCGGEHAGWNLDFQDFFIVPVGAGGYREAVVMASDVYATLKEKILSMGFRGVSDTGGFTPVLKANREALGLIRTAIEDAGYKLSTDISIGIDVASAMFFEDGRYHLRAENRWLSSEEMIDLLQEMVEEYQLVALEDGLNEDDWDNWKKLTGRLKGKVKLIGDDLFATNPDRLSKGIEMGVGDAILVKLNQIGTLTECMDVVGIAKESGYDVIVSKRSGETEDTTIADLAVATGALWTKFGSLARSECLAKYNRMLKIAEELSLC